MTTVFVNRAKVVVSTTGTGTVQLDAALPGYQTLGQAGVVAGNTVRYTIEDGTDWEIGLGVYNSAGPTLTRVLTSSSTGSLLDLSGNAILFVTLAAEDLSSFGGGGVTDGDKGDVIVSGGGTVWELDPAGTLADYVTITGDDTITGQKEFNGVVRLYDELTVFRGYLDPTKVFTFDTTAIPTATTLYYEVPATNGRLALDDVFTTTVKGLVPPPMTVTGKVLSDNGTWITPAGGVVDGTYGEIVVSGSGTVWTIGPSAVDLSQMANLPALTVIGNATASSAAPQALTGADLQNITNMSMGVLQARAQGVGVI